MQRDRPSNVTSIGQEARVHTEDGQDCSVTGRVRGRAILVP